MKCAVLLENHSAFRESLAYLLSREPDIEMVGEASTLEEGRAVVLEDPAQVDVMVTELLLPDGNGLEILRDLREADAEVPVLVLTLLQDRDSHDLALEMGATEVLTKDVAIATVVACIKKLGAN